MVKIIDLVTRLPVHIWFCEHPKRSDAKFEDQLRSVTPAKTLKSLIAQMIWLQVLKEI